MNAKNSINAAAELEELIPALKELVIHLREHPLDSNGYRLLYAVRRRIGQIMAQLQ